MGKGEEGGAADLSHPGIILGSWPEKRHGSAEACLPSLNFILRTHVPVCLRPADQAGGDVIYT